MGDSATEGEQIRFSGLPDFAPKYCGEFEGRIPCDRSNFAADLATWLKKVWYSFSILR